MKTTFTFNKRQAGLSLVEIMVGVLIGMIAVVVIFQVLDVAEKRKRSVTGSSEVQVEGSIAMYMLDRDIRGAGHGFATGAPAGDLNCSVQAYDATRGALPQFAFALVPVVITNGGNAPDTITVLTGSSNTVVNNKAFVASTATSKTMQTEKRFGFMRGDRVVVSNGANCALLEITDNTNADTVSLAHAAAGATYSTDYGATGVTARFNNPAGPGFALTDGRMYNLGPTPRLAIWSVAGGGILGYVDAFSGNTVPVQAASGVINMKAEYGIDANDDAVLAASEWTKTTPTTAAGWANLMAIRVALLVRGEHWDGEHCNANPTYKGTTAGALVDTNFVMTNADGTADSFGADCQPGDAKEDITADPKNWRNYRYRVYETIVPLKNMLWGAS